MNELSLQVATVEERITRFQYLDRDPDNPLFPHGCPIEWQRYYMWKLSIAGMVCLFRASIFCVCFDNYRAKTTGVIRCVSIDGIHYGRIAKSGLVHSSLDRKSRHAGNIIYDHEAIQQHVEQSNGEISLDTKVSNFCVKCYAYL